MHKNNHRLFPAGLLGVLLWMMTISPLVFTACDNSKSDLAVDINLSSDYQGIAEAIKSGSLSLSEALSQLEKVVTNGFSDHTVAQRLLLQAVSSLDGTAEEKLAAIVQAVISQTLSLETKLGLIEAAVTDGFADSDAQQALFEEALSSIVGTAEEKLAAIETAVKGQTASLSAKLALIETAVKEGLATPEAEQQLLQQAFETLEGTIEDKLAAIEAAITGQFAGLGAKLGLIETAVKNGFADSKEALSLLNKAITTLNGTAETKLAAVQQAVQNRQLSLGTKLGLIEAAVAGGFADYDSQSDLIAQAIEGLGDSADTKLDAILDAIASQSSTLSSKLGLIETAVSEGFTADSLQTGLIKDAIAALSGTTEEKLDAIKTAMNLQTSGLCTKLETIQLVLADSLANANDALELMLTAVQSLRTSLAGSDPNATAAADNVLALIRSIGTTLDNQIYESLAQIVDAIKTVNQKDYSAILTAIAEAIEDVGPGAPVLTLSSSSIEGNKIWIMSNDQLSIPFFVQAKDSYELSVTSPQEQGFGSILHFDNPSSGNIILTTGDIVGDNMAVQITITDGSRSSTQTFYYKELIMELISDATHNFAYEGGEVELLYRANVPCTVSVPDTAKNWFKIVSTGDKGDDKYIMINVDTNYGHKLRKTSVSINETLTHESHSIVFYIDQQNSARLKFRDPNLEAMLVANDKVNINRDTVITIAEVNLVHSLEDMFGDNLTTGSDYTTFKEFEYFTGITDIPAGSFHNWKNLTVINIPSTIKTIGGGYGDVNGPFTECPKLDTLNGAFTVGQKALVYNGQLLKVVEPATKFTIPDDVTTIGSKAFYNSKLKNITIPSSVKTIRNHAFEYSTIESVTFAMSGTNLETATAYVDSLAEDAFVHCFWLKEFNGPTKTGTNALRVTPDKLGLCIDTTMCAFALGTVQTTFDIPENMGVKKLADYLFDVQEGGGAVRLHEVKLPSTLTHIGQKDFQAQASVSVLKVHFRGENPPVVESDAFNNINKKHVTLCYPAVLNSDQTVNIDATNERQNLFKNAMGQEDDFFNFEYYIPGP